MRANGSPPVVIQVFRLAQAELKLIVKKILCQRIGCEITRRKRSGGAHNE